MSEVWVTIAALAVTTALIRAAGPAIVGGRDLPEPPLRVIALIAPAVLAALVITETLTAESGDIRVDERLVGVAAAGGALAVRASMLVAVAVAALATALARAMT